MRVLCKFSLNIGYHLISVLNLKKVDFSGGVGIHPYRRNIHAKKGGIRRQGKRLVAAYVNPNGSAGF
jgi:hypothetical protein